MQSWQCRTAPSLGGGFEGTANEAWGTERYWSNLKPAVFFGLYGLKDFYALWTHEGDKAVLFAGSDIRHLADGYWLDETGKIRVDPKPLAKWIDRNCECFCENDVEAEALSKLGILATVVPSFLGNVKDYPLSFKHNKKVKLYTSVSGNDFNLYGWNKIPKLAQANPDVEFHLYGNTEYWFAREKNVFVHGRVTNKQMNEETIKMTGAIRLTDFDGFSELLAKSLLWGQWPVSTIVYPHTLSPENIDMLALAKEPNIEGRKWLLSVVNKYPWNVQVTKN